jgi:hypothetical protein
VTAGLIPVADITSNLVAALAAAYPTGTGRPIGDGQAPADTTTPYGLVYLLAHVEDAAVLLDTPAFTTVAWQVTVVGTTRRQRDELLDRVAAVIPTVSIDSAGTIVGTLRLTSSQSDHGEQLQVMHLRYEATCVSS